MPLQILKGLLTLLCPCKIFALVDYLEKLFTLVRRSRHEHVESYNTNWKALHLFQNPWGSHLYKCFYLSRVSFDFSKSFITFFLESGQLVNQIIGYVMRKILSEEGLSNCIPPIQVDIIHF